MKTIDNFTTEMIEPGHCGLTLELRLAKDDASMKAIIGFFQRAALIVNSALLEGLREPPLVTKGQEGDTRFYQCALKVNGAESILRLEMKEHGESGGINEQG